MARRIAPFCRRLKRDRSGASAVEFALIAPILIVLYFGLAEYSQAMMSDRKVTHVASSIGDLVAQSDQVKEADLTDIFTIGKALLSPFPTASLKMRVTSVKVDSNNIAKVDWCEPSGMADLAKGTVVTLPKNTADPNKNFVEAGQSVIMSEATYTYDSPVKYFLKSGVNFNEKFYLRPRKSDAVTCSDCS